MDAALELTEAGTRPFTGPYFYKEMQGMADATGLPVRLSRNRRRSPPP